ncbi:MAG TPA: glycerol-3-phosphate 1-O-acyltransferase PlsY [Steroidobacter sp.]|jgi:glycerol-3-phosphate acyltransferase PlsY|nr:glycerol-3-phosphate 1-O-acyltransferase PlsY [Steroidobacter sp.]
MLELGFKTLLAYLLGSISGSLLVGQMRGGIDIRTLGSGNAGGTNALRTQGFGFALWVMVIDIGKGWLAAAWFPDAAFGFVTVDPGVDRLWLTTACAAAVVIGHVYPVWYGFRGGKGAATLLGVLVGLEPVALAPALAVWMLVVMLSGYVGLATMLAAASFPVYILASGHPAPAPMLVFGCAMLGFVCYTHRSNIARMRGGSENRARRLWLLRPR